MPTPNAPPIPLTMGDVCARFGLSRPAVARYDAILRPMRVGPRRTRIYDANLVEAFAIERDQRKASR